MHSATVDAQTATGSQAGNRHELIVTWQHPLERSMEPIGKLAFDGHAYSFDYLDTAKTLKDFRPLLGFEDFGRHYVSQELFPIFEERVMDPQRPDYERYVRDLNLPSDASPWEQLASSGGGSESDTLQLYPIPHYSDGVWQCRFLINGSRYLLEKQVEIDGVTLESYEGEVFEEILDSLRPGQELRVVHEDSNKSSATAMLALVLEDKPIGWVPNWLAAEILPLVSDADFTFVVEQVNPASAGWHLRILARFIVGLPADHRFFAGPSWGTPFLSELDV